MTSRSLQGAVVLLTVAMFGCDHATKQVAESTLANGNAVSLVRGVLELRYTQNDDTAFSVLRHLGVPRSPSLMLAVAVLGLIAVAIAWVRNRARLTSVQHTGFALVVAGAIGNLEGRVLRGYVVDFIHLAHWPIFNVADVAVVLGVALLALGAARKPPATVRDAAT